MFTGFLFATLIAVPIGILCGMSRTMDAAINPLIQVFKPVSPLAWLPIVTLIVSAVYVSDDPVFEKSFLVSAITVTLCSLWPTVINTSLGVASIDRDLLNVAKVLRLNWRTQADQAGTAIGAAAIFTGMRLSLGRGLDGADRRRDAGAEPRTRKVRLGRVPERQLRFAAPHHGRGADHRVIGFLLDRVMQTLQALTNFRIAAKEPVRWH